MSKHFKFLFLSVILFVVGHQHGLRHSGLLFSHFNKIIFSLILIRILFTYDLGFLRLPLITLLSMLMGVFLGAAAKSALFAPYQFVMYLLIMAPFFFISTIFINEYRNLWGVSIKIRSVASVLIGFGLFVVFNVFTKLRVPDLSLIQLAVCGAAGFLVSHGTFYLYRREAEDLDGNLPLSFFLGVPILRSLSTLKNLRLRKISVLAFEALYVPLFTALLILTKFNQLSCEFYLKVGWSGSDRPVDLEPCNLDLQSFDSSEFYLIYGALVLTVFCSFLVLNSLKKSWLSLHGKTIVLSALSVLSLFILTDNLNLALLNALCPLSALLIDRPPSRSVS